MRNSGINGEICVKNQQLKPSKLFKAMAVEGPSHVSPWKDPVHVPGDKEHSSSEIQLP